MPAAAGSIEHVVELYTSQGCSSCPPADALLKAYVERPGVLALTFNVDYWDYLGWKDTLASPRHTQRQKAYAKARGDGAVYTPQVIVNGQGHLVGSNKSAIEKALASSTGGLSGSGVGVRISRDGPRIAIETSGGAPGGDDMIVWAIGVAPRVDVQIARGENRGLANTYVNVVRDIKAVGVLKGGERRLELPAESLLRHASDRCAVIVQRGLAGPILAAAWLP